jgi:hypothetical protein
MADFRGIAAAGEALVRLFQASYNPDILEHDLSFKLCSRDDFSATPINAGISVFLYRIVTNGASRTPPGRPGK